MTRHFFLLVLLLGWSTQSAAQEVIGVVKNASDDRPIPTVHVLNLNKVLMSITDANGVFAIDAEINDTLYLSYLGFKSIKITVTNDLIKFPKTEFKLTALALALEEVVVRPYQLTGYLEIDAKNGLEAESIFNQMSLSERQEKSSMLRDNDDTKITFVDFEWSDTLTYDEWKSDL